MINHYKQHMGLSSVQDALPATEDAICTAQDAVPASKETQEWIDAQINQHAPMETTIPSILDKFIQKCARRNQRKD